MRKAISYLFTLCIVLSLGVTAFADPEAVALNPGDIIEFGTYEQDNITGNGPEPIEWIVLDVDGNEAFLVSVHSLDGKRFVETSRRIFYWADSDIRAWLNSDFVETAFTEEEKASLVPVENETEDHSTDLVFLLSERELYQYFLTAEKRICEPTEYAYVQQGDRESWRNIFSSLSVPDTQVEYAKTYFLRTVAPSHSYVYSIDNKGHRNPTERGNELNFIRPAVRVDVTQISSVLEKLNSQYIEISVTDPDEIDFLRDMALGINKRLLTATASSKAEDFRKVVACELDLISKYESVTFPDAEFDEFAHEYIDACQLQQKAIESFDNKAVFEPLWESGKILRAELITKGYEKYGLDIREEDYLSYKNALSSDNNSSGSTGNGPSFEFLEGYWSSRNGMHTFEMKKDRSYITTVPVVPHCGDTYILDNGVIRSYYASNPSQKTDNLKITVVSDTEIEIYSYQTKTSYTLIKRR